MLSDATWNRINDVTGPIGMLLAGLLLLVLLVLTSPLYLLSWIKRKIGWGWRPRIS